MEGFNGEDVGGLKDAVEAFIDANYIPKQEYEGFVLENAIDKALIKCGAKNEKALKALINKDGLKFKDGTVEGLDGQIENIKKECSYLFNLDSVTTGASHSTGLEQDFDSMSDSEYYNYVLNKKGNE